LIRRAKGAPGMLDASRGRLRSSNCRRGLVAREALAESRLRRVLMGRLAAGDGWRCAVRSGNDRFGTGGRVVEGGRGLYRSVAPAARRAECILAASPAALPDVGGRARQRRTLFAPTRTHSQRDRQFSDARQGRPTDAGGELSSAWARLEDLASRAYELLMANRARSFLDGPDATAAPSRYYGSAA